MTIWHDLGIEPTADAGAIRRAYALRLRQVHPEDDPEGFQRLRAAYEAALLVAERDGPAVAPDPPGAVTQDAATANDQAGDDRTGEALAALLNNVLWALALGDPAAAGARLEAAVKDPLLINIETRALFQKILLFALETMLPLPRSFAETAVRIFRWDEDLRHLTPRQRLVVEHALGVQQGRRRLDELRGAAGTWFRYYPFDKAPLAAALLTGAYRPRWFRLAALNPDLRAKMATLLNELRCCYPEILTTGLDPRTLAHWLRVVDQPPGRGRALFGQVVSLYSSLALVGFLALWLGAGALELNPPVALWVGAIAMAVVALILDLAPLLIRFAFLILALPPWARGGLGISLAAGAGLLGVTLDSPWGDAVLVVTFLCFMAMGDERDLMNYIRGVLLVWLGVGLMVRYSPLPPVDLKVILLAAQVVVFAGLMIRRRTGTRADGEPRHEYPG